MKNLTWLFYNLGPVGERVDNARARLELSAHANNHDHDPDRARFRVMGYVECVGRAMPELDHYDRYRSTKNESRRNVSLYALASLDSGPAEWWDGKVWWWRPRDPDTRHPPRSTLWVPVEGWLVGVAHAPERPSRRWVRRANETLVMARREWMNAHVEKMRHHKGPVLLMADTNGLARELRRRVPKLTMFTQGVDSMHTSEVIESADAHGGINGVASWSDHPHFIAGKVRKRG